MLDRDWLVETTTELYRKIHPVVIVLGQFHPLQSQRYKLRSNKKEWNTRHPFFQLRFDSGWDAPTAFTTYIIDNLLEVDEPLVHVLLCCVTAIALTWIIVGDEKYLLGRGPGGTLHAHGALVVELERVFGATVKASVASRAVNGW